jgi:uncharacterized protein with FMN-binding domain
LRRAILALASTIAGLAALLSFRTHPAALVTAEAGPVSSGPATTAPSEATSQSPATHPHHPRRHTHARPTGSKTGSKTRTKKAGKAASARTLTVTGSVAQTQYGPMQVQVTLTGHTITKVVVLQHTDDGQRSDQIDATALPELVSETLAAQSAQIHSVTGASYTSAGYLQSLQSALDRAGQ